MVTTTSSTTTSATQKVAQNATAALLTSLGAGSGIDMTSLATNLATAQFAAKTDRLSTRSETLDKQISAASTLKSAISNLATSLGDRVRTGDLSPQPLIGNAAVAKVSASSNTAQLKGSYSIEVSTLATSQTLVSPAYGASTDAVGSGSLKLTFGTIAGTTFTDDPARTAIDITIPSGATLADVATAINGANTGVTAYVSNTTAGAKLVLKGSDGAINGFKLEATETVGEEGLANLNWNPSMATADRVLTTAGNANLKIDGLPITSASNTLVDAIPGVTLSLTGTNSGSPTQVTFNDPSTAITTAMTDLTAALNEIVAQINEATDAKTGDLARDSGAMALKRAFQALTSTIIMPNAAEGEPQTLSDLGVSIQRDGTFVLDGARLAKTLAANPAATAAMFTNGLNGVYGTISKISTTMASASTETKSYGATLANSIAQLTKQKTDLTDAQTKLTEQQETLRQQLISRFSAADSSVGNSKSTMSFLKNQIAVWNGTNNN